MMGFKRAASFLLNVSNNWKLVSGIGGVAFYVRG